MGGDIGDHGGRGYGPWPSAYGLVAVIRVDVTAFARVDVIADVRRIIFERVEKTGGVRS